MNPEGGSAWPSLGRLVRMTGLSLPTVIRSIKTAEELGELVIDRKTGGRPPKGAHASNDYVLVMDAETESKSNATLPLDDAKGSRHVTPKSNATLPLRVTPRYPNHKGTTNRTTKKNLNKKSVIRAEKPTKEREEELRAKTPNAILADATVREWWDASDPKPTHAGGFVGARKIVKKCLDAGWSADELGRALPTLDTLAAWSLEKALKSGRSSVGANTKRWYEV